MAEQNTRDEARVLLKKITDFNVANDYYQKEEKEEIARDFKKLIFVDDPTVRKFLEKWINKTKEVAFEYDLMGSKTEVDKDEEEETAEEETAEKEEAEDEEGKEEPKEEPAEEKVAEEAPAEETPDLPLENKVYESYIDRANDLVV